MGNLEADSHFSGYCWPEEQEASFPFFFQRLQYWGRSTIVALNYTPTTEKYRCINLFLY